MPLSSSLHYLTLTDNTSPPAWRAVPFHCRSPHRLFRFRCPPHFAAAMISDKKRSSRRISSLFSLGSNGSDQQGTASAASSESSGRLSKVKDRIASATHLTPDYPPPEPPEPPSLRHLTITPVESAPAALQSLQPPRSISSPVSRSSSPSRPNSPGTPNSDGGGGLLAPADAHKKLKRRSRLFAGTQSSDERISEPGPRPLAWVVGHRGKVPYNLTMLLNGEKVSLHVF